MRFAPVLFAASAMAYYTADTSEDPSGNAIALPGLNDLVPAGETYTITWDPTTDGNVSLVLLRGPSTNCVYLETIVDSIKNTGSYDWSVPTSLEPDTTHYGIELACPDGSYQYSTQFGVSNDAYSNDTSSASSVVASATSFAMTATGGASYSTGGAHLGSSSTNGSFTFATSTVTSTAHASTGAVSTTTSSSAKSSSSAATGAAGKTGLSIGAVFAAAGLAAAMM